MPEMLLTVEQAAERLQVHQETVRRHLQAGTLRGIKRGRVWRVPEAALLESSLPSIASVEANIQAAQRAFGLLATNSGATGARTVDDFMADRSTQGQAELLEAEAAPNLDALFAPPTPAEIARRLSALDSLISNSPPRDPAAPEVDLEADPWGYEERADNLRESRQ